MRVLRKIILGLFLLTTINLAFAGIPQKEIQKERKELEAAIAHEVERSFPYLIEMEKHNVVIRLLIPNDYLAVMVKDMKEIAGKRYSSNICEIIKQHPLSQISGVVISYEKVLKVLGKGKYNVQRVYLDYQKCPR